MMAKNPYWTLDFHHANDAEKRRILFSRIASALAKAESEEARLEMTERMMESAFRSGIECGRANGGFYVGRTDLTFLKAYWLPRSLKKPFLNFCYGLFGGFYGGRYMPRKPEPAYLASFLRPASSEPEGTLVKDEWIFPLVERGNTVGTYTMTKFCKAGLAEDRDLGEGWRVAILSEWGYELAKLEQTLDEKCREPGMSSTCDEWLELANASPSPAWQAAEKLGLLSRLERLLEGNSATSGSAKRIPPPGVVLPTD